MKSKKQISVSLLSASLFSLVVSAASNVSDLSSRYESQSQLISRIDNEDSQKESYKKRIKALNKKLIKTLTETENILYQVTENFSSDLVRNLDFNDMLSRVSGVISYSTKFLEEDLITKSEFKNLIYITSSVKNKINRIIEIKNSLDRVPTYYDCDIAATDLSSLADSITHKLLSEIKNKA